MAIAKDKFINLGLMFVLGGIGGILGCQLLLPWLAGFSFLKNIDWIKNIGERTTVINRTERIVITENEALGDAIEKGSGIVLGIVSERTEKIIAKKKITLEKPEILAKGTGFIITSDGMIATAESVVPETSQQVLIVFNNKQALAEIKKRDKNSGLVLLKIDEANLPAVSFNEENLKLGQSVFLIGAKFGVLSQDGQSQLIKFIDANFIKETSPEIVVGFNSKEILGSPLFNIKGEVVGINSVDSSGQAKVILSSKIRELLR